MQSATPARVLLLLIMWVFLGMGLLFLAGALIWAHFTRQFLRSSITTQGRIVALLPVRSTGRHHYLVYAPVFRFDVPGTHFATVVSHNSSSPPAFEVGQVVTVRYQPGHPEKAVIDSFEQLWLGELVLGIVGVMSIGSSLLMLLFMRMQKRRSQTIPDSGSGITRF
jgi:hypothetical protein